MKEDHDLLAFEIVEAQPTAAHLPDLHKLADAIVVYACQRWSYADVAAGLGIGERTIGNILKRYKPKSAA